VVEGPSRLGLHLPPVQKHAKQRIHIAIFSDHAARAIQLEHCAVASVGVGANVVESVSCVQRDAGYSTGQNSFPPQYNNEAVPEFVRYIPDKGFYTPMLNLIYAIQESHTMQGVLYVHDDMTLSSALLTHIGTETWVATFNPEDRLRWLRDGTFTGNTPPSSWVWWQRDCASPLQNIASDPDMDQFLGENGSLPIARGQSDMLYVNTLQPHADDCLHHVAQYFCPPQVIPQVRYPICRCHYAREVCCARSLGSPLYKLGVQATVSVDVAVYR